MPSMQIVFLFDLNAYTEDNLKIGPDLNKNLLSLRLTCLKILTHYYTFEPNLKWGFKFFDSRGSLTQKMCKFSFSTVSLENFEILENELCVQYQRHASYLDALTVSAEQNDPSTSAEIVPRSTNVNFYPVQVLQLALTQILCEYQWSNQMDFFSPSTKHIYKHMDKNDILFLITKCPQREEDFSEYFGTNSESMTTSSKFSKILLSRSLHEQLLLKSSILWIWLNTNSDCILVDSTTAILNKVADLLRCLKCALIPISAFAQPPHVIKFEENSQQRQTVKMDLLNSLMPFSKIFSQSITYPFYSDMDVLSSTSIIYFKDKGISVDLTKVPLQWNSKVSRLQSKTEDSDALIRSLIWSNFVVQFAIPKKTCFQTCDIHLCLPSVSSNKSNYTLFQDFNKILILEDINLFIICESKCGIKMSGLFSPLSDTSALISILDPKELLNGKSNISFGSLGTSHLNKDKVESSKDTVHSDMDIQLCNSMLKPFQIECMENWYNPTSNICRLLPLRQEPHKCFSALKPFYKKLQMKFSRNQKPLQEKENIAPTSDTQEENSSNNFETYEVSDITYEELIKMLTAVYDLALRPCASVVHSARKIVKSGYSFFQMKSCETRSLEDALKDFMAEFFCVSNRKMIEKYDLSQENDKIIQECQLQVILALEIEVLFPSSDRSNSVNTVTSFLRTMSFYSGASELNKFLFEILRENYKDTLYDVLVEIGDELDIPLFEEEDDSADEPSEPPSVESMLGSNNSMQSSALSVKSSSSASSRTGNRKLIRQRSDIQDTKSRQFLLTKSSPKKKKYKNLCPGGENIPIRYSPRLSSKRKKERQRESNLNPSHVRRNLFPKDHKLLTPRLNSSASPRKKRLPTPKAHHVLKTHFVPETPSSKQNRSALQRRKSFMDTDDSENSVKEIAESPKIVKHVKDNAHIEILKRLSSLNSNTFVQPERQSLPGRSSGFQYTPESKRRLSLKLFSKYLISPTARMGLKKCSKRLFDQVSPQVEKETYKKPRLEHEVEDEIAQSPDGSP